MHHKTGNKKHHKKEQEKRTKNKNAKQQKKEQEKQVKRKSEKKHKKGHGKQVEQKKEKRQKSPTKKSGWEEVGDSKQPEGDLREKPQKRLPTLIM